eukprot:scaffold12338_cov107-Amphora_coffeaeformis.AAC.1
MKVGYGIVYTLSKNNCTCVLYYNTIAAAAHLARIDILNLSTGDVQMKNTAMGFPDIRTDEKYRYKGFPDVRTDEKYRYKGFPDVRTDEKYRYKD